MVDADEKKAGTRSIIYFLYQIYILIRFFFLEDLLKFISCQFFFKNCLNIFEAFFNIRQLFINLS